MGKPPFGGKPSGGKPPFGQKKGNPFQKKGNPFQKKPGGFGDDPFGGPPKPDKSVDADDIKKDQKEIEDVKKMRAAADAEVRKAMVGKYNAGEDTVEFYPAMMSFGTFTNDKSKSDEDKDDEQDEKPDDKPEKSEKKVAEKDEKPEAKTKSENKDKDEKSKSDDKDEKKKPAKKDVKNTLKEAAEAYPVIGSIDSLLNFTRKRNLTLAWEPGYRAGASTWLPDGTVVRLLADGSVVGLHKDGQWSKLASLRTR